MHHEVYEVPFTVYNLVLKLLQLQLGVYFGIKAYKRTECSTAHTVNTQGRFQGGNILYFSCMELKSQNFMPFAHQ